jgi:heme/copper-type cytochrome/quinol oxidase subunit 3
MFKELDYKSKLEVMKKYSNTNKGKGLASTLDRLLIESLVLFVSTILIIVAVIIADLPVWCLGVAGLTLIFGLIFFLAQLNIRNKEYNKFLEHLSKSEKNKLTKRK